MIYLTGDTHGDFDRFSRKERKRLPFELTKEDYLVICGDFGLLWEKNRTLIYHLKWMSKLPFTILWVQGNHENYNMIEEYPISKWNGGKVRHIIQDKVILLERGQIFTIENNIFFSFGGASSHDIQGGILDRTAADYKEQYKKVSKSGLPFRVLNYSWWEQELPTKEELEEGLKNLEMINYKVDYVITHCLSNHMQTVLKQYDKNTTIDFNSYKSDRLTDYFEILEDRLSYKHWFCGHYHNCLELDNKHTILYKNIVPLNRFN